MNKNELDYFSFCLMKGSDTKNEKKDIKNYGNDERSELALHFFDRFINDHKSVYLKDTC